MFCKKGVLRNPHRNTCARASPVNFVKFLRTPFHKEYLWWLLLEEGKAFLCSRGIVPFRYFTLSVNIIDKQILLLNIDIDKYNIK